jgi:hypothetical protein
LKSAAKISRFAGFYNASGLPDLKMLAQANNSLTNSGGKLLSLAFLPSA